MENKIRRGFHGDSEFSDVLKNVGLDPKRVKLIRHSLGDKAFKKCYDKGMVEEYTRVQSETFSNGYDYWCVFISDKSTTAKFFACYKGKRRRY